MFDLKITGGLVLDGSGADAIRADVGVRGEFISDVGELAEAEARVELNVPADYCVTPGFIDVHSHSDAYLLIEPSAQSKIHQGITTEVCGNCGASVAPIRDRSQLPSDWASHTYPGEWSTVADYRELLEQAHPAVNVALLIGHNTLRRNVVGYEDRHATAPEVVRMQDLLREALEQGGCGLSTGLVYAPGMYATEEEIVALAKVAAEYDAIYTSHMRSEGDELLESIEETLRIGEKAELRVEVSHLKIALEPNWGKVDRAIELIRDARERGQPVAADRYPYTAGATELDVVFPDWAAAGGREAVLARLADATQRSRLYDELLERRPTPEEWAGITIGSTTHSDNRRYRGVKLVDVAADMDCHPVEAILRLCERDELQTGAFFAGMSEENMRRILAEPFVMLGSDASLRALDGPLGNDYPHPRAYGAYPRFLRMVLDEDVVTLPDAVRKMTSLPATQFGLTDRGKLKKGKKADIVVFNPRTVHGTAHYGNPHQLAEGIEYVVVNGKLSVEAGKDTGQRGGVFLG